MSQFPNVFLVVMHSNMNINMDLNKRVHTQTSNKQQKINKQTCGHLKTGLKPFNLTEPSPH